LLLLINSRENSTLRGAAGGLQSLQESSGINCGSIGCGKRLYFTKNPEIRPSVAKAMADLIELIGTAKAMPFQN